MRAGADPVRIAIVDDEPTILRTLSRVLGNVGYETVEFDHGQGALDLLASQPPDLLLCDICLPPPDGLEILKIARTRQPDMPVIMLTGQPSVEGAVQAVKEGAFDYVTKPFEADELRVVVEKALQFRSLTQENRRLRADIRDRYDFSTLIGISRPFTAVIDRVKRVVDTRSTVLITGESGTGKDVLARAIHYNSPRRDRLYVAVNCTAIPEQLMESEMFGHEKGAFSGAVQARKGLFEEADGGTLFLDEIGDLPLAMQAKLLRVLQDGMVRRVGATRHVQVDTRIVAATNKDLLREVADGRFREDLYYRLAVVQVHMPPLRDRVEDIALLAQHFMTQYSRLYERPARRLSLAVLRDFQSRRWSGNVRELANAVERAVLLTEQEQIEIADIMASTPAVLDEARQAAPPRSASVPSGGDLDMKGALHRAVESVERQYIERALHATGGNRTRAARALGISHRNLMYKLKQYPELAASRPGEDGAG